MIAALSALVFAVANPIPTILVGALAYSIIGQNNKKEKCRKRQ